MGAPLQEPEAEVPAQKSPQTRKVLADQLFLKRYPGRQEQDAPLPRGLPEGGDEEREGLAHPRGSFGRKGPLQGGAKELLDGQGQFELLRAELIPRHTRQGAGRGIKFFERGVRDIIPPDTR